MEDQTCSPTTDVEALVPSIWRKHLHRVLAGFYFQDIALRLGERLPDSGAILFLGLHRNGALDGLVYNSVLPASVYMMSRQLTCNPIGRVLFCGIEVIREKDRATFPDSRKVNREAMKQCHKVLESGTNLFVFPEGTSSLGPRRLPLQSGAAHLINGLLTEERAISVVPVGITYDAPEEFRSNVEVIVGHPLTFLIDPSMPASERLAEIKQRIDSGLDEIGINVESAQRFDEIQHFARHRLAGSFHAELKRLERGGRPQTTSSHSLSRLQRFAKFLILLPIVIAASLLNLPPLLAANESGKKLADDRNVVSLFRVMAGSAAFGFWIPAAVTISAFAYGWAGAASYAIISLAGLCCWNCFKTTARALPGAWLGGSKAQANEPS